MDGDKGSTYKRAGVDIDAANRSVEMIKKWVDRTKRSEVLEGIGAFGGFFALDNRKYREPVLVSGTDGVGTKLRVAQMYGVYDTVGIDLVAMCVNDILAHGAEPLFFLDYLAVGKLEPVMIEELVKGVSEGCLQAGCALIGGETAEMPGFYGVDEFDMAGFAVGVVERSRLINGSTIKHGDALVGLKSSGLHSNGYSLARKVLLEDAGLKLGQHVEELGQSLGEALLTPTRIYVHSILTLLEEIEVRGMAHITGGGLVENLQRIMPAGLRPDIVTDALEPHPIFDMIARLGQVEPQEMLRTFNMGIGYVLVVAPEKVKEILMRLRLVGQEPLVIGQVGFDDRWLR